MKLTQSHKEQAIKALDDKNILALLTLIFKFGFKALELISDLIQERKNANKNDIPSNS